MDNFFKNLNNEKGIQVNQENDVDLSILLFKLFKRKKTIIFSTLAGILFGCSYLFFSKPIYQGRIKILIKRNSDIPSEVSITDEIRQSFGAFKNQKLSTELQVLKSPSVLLPVFEYVQSLKIDKNINISRLSFSRWSKDNFVLEILPRTEILNIAYRDTEREIIEPVLEKIIFTIQTYSLSERNRSLNNGINYLKEQKEIYQKKSQKSLESARSFALENDLLPPSSISNKELSVFPSSGDLGLTNYASTEISKVKSKKILKDLRQDLKIIKEYKDQNSYPSFLTTNEKYNILPVIKDLINTETTLNDLRGKFKENDIAIKNARYQREIIIKSMKKQIIKFINEEIDSVNNIIENSEKPQEIIAEYSNLLKQNLKNDSTLSEIENNFIKLSLEKARQSEPWEVISDPIVGSKPISPNILITLILSSFVGGLLSIIYLTIENNRNGVLYFFDEFKNFLKYPLLISFPNLADNKDLMVSLATKLNKEYKNKKIIFLAINSQTKRFYKPFYNEISKLLENINTAYESELNEESDFDNIIILLAAGKSNRNEAIRLSKLLSLNSKIIGSIFEEL